MRLFFLVLIATTLEANVVTSAICDSGAGTVTTSPSSCSASGTYDFPELPSYYLGWNASASTTASYSIVGNSFSVETSGSVAASGPKIPDYVIENRGFVYPPEPTATASSSMTVDFYTPGPMRPGFVFVYGGEGSSFGASVGFSMNGVTSVCDGPCFIPVELGTTMEFTESALASYQSPVSDLSPSMPQFYDLDFGFSFYEADGTGPYDSTPVDLIEVPEPSALALLFVGFVGAIAYRSTRGVA